MNAPPHGHGSEFDPLRDLTQRGVDLQLFTTVFRKEPPQLLHRRKSLLAQAAKHNRLQIATWLLNEGKVDVNSGEAPEIGIIALSHAKSPEMVRLLMDAGANPFPWVRAGDERKAPMTNFMLMDDPECLLAILPYIHDRAKPDSRLNKLLNKISKVPKKHENAPMMIERVLDNAGDILVQAGVSLVGVENTWNQTMPIPLYTSEKPSTSSTSETSTSPTTATTNSAQIAAAAGGATATSSRGSDTARDEAVRTAAHKLGEGGTGTMSKEEAERLYEERIEEEYAKREGGA
ncbi:hypothetical protein EX30DRAFT_371654 [Ascodesmis nigricans]|uniref:Ankyrin n=1 Tax=Ascodesmis nigricans TaxID=341454 RepID=A0A4S2MX93_9PEZI|nr:hypothetical protein EX30DRAFT_371654 [Ascodesmis nigricans]